MLSLKVINLIKPTLEFDFKTVYKISTEKYENMCQRTRVNKSYKYVNYILPPYLFSYENIFRNVILAFAFSQLLYIEKLRIRDTRLNVLHR